MKPLDAKTRDLLWFDPDVREVRLRQLVTERMAASSLRPTVEDHVVATYFLALRHTTLHSAAKEIAYHATSGSQESAARLAAGRSARHTRPASTPGTRRGRMGLLHVAFPLKMLLQPDGHLTSCDLLHTVAGAIIFDVYESQDARLVSLADSRSTCCGRFPGRPTGRAGLRAADRLRRRGAGLRHDPEADGRHHAGRSRQPGGRGRRSVRCSCSSRKTRTSIPNLDYSPVAERVRQGGGGHRAGARRSGGGKGLIFAPHITGAPHEMLETAARGDRGRGHRRDVQRDLCRRHGADGPRGHEAPAAAAGHLRPQRRHRREDPRRHLARSDRPVGPAGRHRFPPDGPDPARARRSSGRTARNGRRRSEILSRELPGIKPTMIVRAGGLDQGNIILNLADAERRGLTSNVLFLAGSAINSVKNADGPARSAARGRGHAAGAWKSIARANWPTRRSTSTCTALVAVARDART